MSDHAKRGCKIRQSVTALSLARTLDAAAVECFVQHYQRLTEHILAEMPARADLIIALDARRRPVAWHANNRGG